MALLEIEQATAHRETMSYEASLAAVNLEIERIQALILQATDAGTISILEQQKALLVAQAGALTQAVAALKAHEVDLAQWIATMAQPTPSIVAIADVASKLLALLNVHENQLRVLRDNFRKSDESTWATSVSLSDLGRKLDELTAKMPDVNASKNAWEKAETDVQAYIEQLTS